MTRARRPTSHGDRAATAARAHIDEEDDAAEGQVEESSWRHARVHVGVAGALDVAVGRVDEFPLGDDVAEAFIRAIAAPMTDSGFTRGENLGVPASRGYLR